MNAGERIQDLKNTSPLSKFEKRRKRATAIVLAVATLISVMLFVYAFIQKLEAEEQYQLVIQLKAEADRQRNEAEKQKIMAELARMEADKQRLLAITVEQEKMQALQALEKCKKR